MEGNQVNSQLPSDQCDTVRLARAEKSRRNLRAYLAEMRDLMGATGDFRNTATTLARLLREDEEDFNRE